MSGESTEENEATENAQAEAEKRKSNLGVLKSGEPVSDAQLENKVDVTVEVENEKPEETNSEEGGEKALTDNDGEDAAVSEMNGDHMLDEDPYASDDDEEDDLWHFDDGKSDDDDDSDEEEASEEEATEGGVDEDNSEGDDEEAAIKKDGVSEGEAMEEEDEEENAEAGKGIAKEDGEGAEEPKSEKAEVNLKKKRGKKSKGWGEMNKLTEGSPQKVAQGENSKSSLKKKSKNKVASMGMIFMCSSKTKSDCFKYKVLGLPESKKNVVEKIYSGMRLFLYDVDLKLMYGIYKAQGPGGYNIVRKAFKSKFPSQVRFTVLRDCLPLAEEKFKKVIKENYFTSKKFDGQLNSDQVRKLCKLFVSLSKGTPTKSLPRSRKVEKQPIPVRREIRKSEKQPIPVRRESRRAEKQPILGRQESKINERASDRKRPPLRGKSGHVERSRKHPRRAISPVSRSRQPPMPSAPLTALDRNLDADPYRRELYLDGHDRDHYRRDPYESRRDRPIEYREERDLYLERRDPYRDGRDPYLDCRDPYRDSRDLYLDRRAPHTEARDPFPDRRIRYHDALDPYPLSRDPYRDAQDVYVSGPMYKDVREPEPYDPYRRELLPDSRGVYGEDRGVAYRDPYRPEEALDRPLSLESRRHFESVRQDPCVSYRAIPSTGLPLHSVEYPSRPVLTREYRL